MTVVKLMVDILSGLLEVLRLLLLRLVRCGLSHDVVLFGCVLSQTLSFREGW